MDAACALPVSKPVQRWRAWATPVRLIFGLTFAALLVRLIGLAHRPLWLDESYSAWFSSRSWQYLWTVVPTYEPHPPFYYSLLKLWRSMFGGSPVALRSLSVLFAVLTVPLVVACVSELEKRRPTGRYLLHLGLALFLVAFSPMLLLLDQEVRPYPFMIFAYAAATLGLLKLMREFASGLPGKLGSWALLACGTELALWAHGLGLLYALFLGLALVPSWLGQPVTRERLFRGIAAALLILVAYVPCLLMIIGRAGDWGSGWLRWDPIFLLQLLALYAVPVEVLTVGSAVAGLSMLLLVKRAMQSALAQKSWTEETALLLLWWGPPLAAVLISALYMPIFLPRTLAATLIPAYLLMAGSLARLTSKRERLVLAAAIAVPLIPTAVQVGLRPATEQWDEVGSYLASNAGPRDLVWLYPNDSELPLRQAVQSIRYKVRGIPGDYPAVEFPGPIRAGSPAVRSLTHDQAVSIASDPAVRGAATIWLVTRQHGLFDPDDEMPKALGSVRRPGKLQQWGYIEVRPFYSR